MLREDPKAAAETTKPTEPAESTETSSETPAAAEPAPKPRKPRGFATMDRERVRELARRGGTTAHARGTAHEFTSDEAKEAGRKGGIAAHAKRRAARNHPTS